MNAGLHNLGDRVSLVLHRGPGHGGFIAGKVPSLRNHCHCSEGGDGAYRKKIADHRADGKRAGNVVDGL